MKKRPWPLLLTFGLGLFLVVMTVLLFPEFPPKQEGLPGGFKTPILLLEFAQTQSDLAPFSGLSESAKTLRAQSLKGHPIDNVFCFAYGFFAASLFMIFALDRKRKLWLRALAYVGMGFSLLAIVGDLNENRILVEATLLLDAQKSALSLLPEFKPATWIKWGAIGIFQFLLGLIFLADTQSSKGVRIFLAAVCILPAIQLLLTYLTGQGGEMVEGASRLVSIFFLVFALRSVYQIIRPPR